MVATTEQGVISGVCVCVCVCVKARVKGRAKAQVKGSANGSVRVRVKVRVNVKVKVRVKVRVSVTGPRGVGEVPLSTWAQIHSDWVTTPNTEVPVLKLIGGRDPWPDRAMASRWPFGVLACAKVPDVSARLPRFPLNHQKRVVSVHIDGLAAVLLA